MKKIFGIVAAITGIFLIAYFLNRKPVHTIDKAEDFQKSKEIFCENMVDRMNSDKRVVTVSGVDISEFQFDFIVSDKLKLYVEKDFLKSLLSCSVMCYEDDRVIVMKGDNIIALELGSNQALVNGNTTINMASIVYKDEENGKIFIPIDDISDYLSYEVAYHFDEDRVDLVKLEGEKLLPSAYDMRDYDRVTEVRDQGRYGTCWAFASLGALETTLKPMENTEFSVDHMSKTNSYNLDVNRGGEHTMSIAYLAAWQGPVYEKDDPYGDGETNPDLKAVKHLEEALVINDRDFDILKSAIFRYGAIETSLYSQMEYADSYSRYYSEENCSYYYDGDAAPNHDVVVVGWDDNYSRDNFTIAPEGDGAFICKNSWGKEFGEDGYFYVSYYDSNICNKAVVYTRVGEADNFDRIYHSDLLGWVGLMGFGKEEAYFANVYTAGESEELAAVSFYATDKNTEFEVYVVEEFEDTDSFKERKLLTAGRMQYAGYYTVRIPEPVRLKDNTKYAVVVKIKTENAIHPIAIEYNADERTESFDISDGEGYISLYGEMWHSAEETQNCNVCLKAFTNIVEEE